MPEFKVEYLIASSDDNGGCAEITAALRMAEPEKLLAVASLEVDGIELLPSVRLLFAPETPEIALPPVRIFRPISGRRYGFAITLRLPGGNVILEESLEF